MRRDATIDGKQVICRNASMLGYSSVKLRVGMVFTVSDEYGGDGSAFRMIGRIAYAPALRGDAGPIRNWILALVLSNDGTFCYERWINPEHVTSTHPVPSRMAEFFFAPKLPYDVATLRRLEEYGTLSDQFVQGAAHHVAAWRAGVSPAVYRAPDNAPD